MSARKLIFFPKKWGQNSITQDTKDTQLNELGISTAHLYVISSSLYPSTYTFYFNIFKPKRKRLWGPFSVNLQQVLYKNFRARYSFWLFLRFHEFSAVDIKACFVGSTLVILVVAFQDKTSVWIGSSLDSRCHFNWIFIDYPFIWWRNLHRWHRSATTTRYNFVEGLVFCRIDPAVFLFVC